MAFIGGTELDGILEPTAGAGDPIMLFQGNVIGGSTGNTLTFIIADSGDTQLDSTVYIEGLARPTRAAARPAAETPFRNRPQWGYSVLDSRGWVT